MKKLVAAGMILVSSITLVGCASPLPQVGRVASDFPLNITNMPSDQGQWGTYCQTVMGTGWICIVEVKVNNPTKQAWSGTLTANLIGEDGSVNASSDSYENTTLTGSFSNIVNPNKDWSWAVYFSVAEGVRFTGVDFVDESGQTVAQVPTCIGSTDADMLGCSN